MSKDKFSQGDIISYMFIGFVFAGIAYYLEKTHNSWETEAKQADAVIVKEGLVPRVKFTPEDMTSVEATVGTVSSEKHNIGEKLQILYKPGASPVVYYPNNPPFDVRIRGKRTLDVMIGYLAAILSIIAASGMSILNSIKSMKE